MPGTELDTIADLLRRWQRVDEPMERVRVVTDATEALRNLSSMDTRVLAQGLWEHGAGPAAEQVAHRTGTSVAPEELAEVAQHVLSLDRHEVERLAGELRDPEQRRRLLTASGVPEAEVRHHLPERPPVPDRRFDLPPPPGAAEVATTPDVVRARTGDDDATPAPGETDAEVPASPSEADTEVAAAPSARADVADAVETDEDDAADPEARRGGETIQPSTEIRVSPTGGPYGSSTVGSRSSLEPPAGLVESLREATNGRERLRYLDAAPAIVDGDHLLRLLQAVPDGWQRRTVLRKLLSDGRVHDVTDPRSAVTAFDRAGDRFAAAALLVRSGVSDVEAVLPALTPRDAARLQRRAQR